jgi:hypothetical protein
MVLWWIKITAALGCIGVFILSIVMLAHTKGETDPRAIFWFCVAIAAVGAFFLVANIDHNRPRRVRRAKYWVVYHGTPTWTSAAGAITTGFVPGPGDRYGPAVYMSFDYEYARSFAQGGGYIFQLYISRKTPIVYYSQIPGHGWAEKRECCLRNGIGLVYVEEDKFIISFGYRGAPVKIPGLKKVEVFDGFGNQVTIQ